MDLKNSTITADKLNNILKKDRYTNRFDDIDNIIMKQRLEKWYKNILPIKNDFRNVRDYYNGRIGNKTTRLL